jgi:hypothetical protein
MVPEGQLTPENDSSWNNMTMVGRAGIDAGFTGNGVYISDHRHNLNRTDVPLFYSTSIKSDLEFLNY